MCFYFHLELARKLILSCVQCSSTSLVCLIYMRKENTLANFSSIHIFLAAYVFSRRVVRVPLSIPRHLISHSQTK